MPMEQRCWKFIQRLVGRTKFVRISGRSDFQFAEILRALGARHATALDGGTSTTLLIRRSVGGPLVRLDRPISEYQRPVVDALVFRG